MVRFIKKIKTLIASPLPWYKMLMILLGRLVLKSLLFIGDLLDNVFFRGYKSIELIKPVFLVGHPRSGTTFLHRFLLNNLPDYRGMRLWDMVVPSIFLRKLLNPLIHYLDNLSNKKLYDPKIHHTGLLKEETDDVALFFKSFDGLFFWLYFSAFRKLDLNGDLKKDLIEYSNLKKTLDNIKILHRKNLFAMPHRKQMFSKSFSLILGIENIIEKFPGAKIILLMRDPLEVIPSSMSLTRNVLQNLYHFDKLNNQFKDLYYSNLYHASIIFYKSLHEIILKQDKYKDNLKLIPYSNLKDDFSSTIISILEFLEIKMSNELKFEIEEQRKRQKHFKSDHKYSLEEFGLDESTIRSDFKFIYDNYNV